MKYIKLTQGKFAIVDDEDYAKLMKHKWYAKQTHGIWYAFTHIRVGSGRIGISMHRFLLNPPAGMQVDHKDHNGLDNRRYNRRYNIRICTHAQNIQNQRRKQGSKTSKYKGVFWHTKNKYWYVQIKQNGKKTSLGAFDNEIEAAKTYDKKAIELFGEFANTNFNLYLKG